MERLDERQILQVVTEQLAALGRSAVEIADRLAELAGTANPNPPYLATPSVMAAPPQVLPPYPPFQVAEQPDTDQIVHLLSQYQLSDISYLKLQFISRVGVVRYDVGVGGNQFYFDLLRLLVNQWKGGYVYFLSGPSAGEFHIISSNGTDSITVSDTFDHGLYAGNLFLLVQPNEVSGPSSPSLVVNTDETDYNIVKVDLTTAHADYALGKQGTSLTILDLGGANWSFKLIDTSHDPIQSTWLTNGTRIILDFADIYVTNAAAAAGTAPAVLYVARR